MDDVAQVRQDLKAIIESSGGIYLMSHIREQMDQGWREFIKLPVLQKTSKAAFNYQARYDEMKKLVDWIEDEIKTV